MGEGSRKGALGDSHSRSRRGPGGWFSEGFWGRSGLDGPGRWLLGMAAVILGARALSDAAEVLAEGSGGRLAGVSSDLALVAAVVVAVALLPVIGHGFFGAGWSSPEMGRISSRVAPAGLLAALCLLAASVLFLLAHLALS